MWKGHAHATGPKTKEGIAAVTENIAGHPTPEEAKRTRFNAMTHGAYARVASYFPARPGAYQHCEGCHHLNNGCGEQPACLKRTELYLRHQAAFQAGDPAMLTDLRADLHARISAIIDDITLAIIRRGVEIETPQWYYDKDGVFHLAKYKNKYGEEIILKEVRQHPLLKTLGEYIGKIGLSLGEQGMTPKVQEDHDIMRGHLDSASTTPETLEAYQATQTSLLEQLKEQITVSQKEKARDPVLIEHKQADGNDG